MTYRALKLGTLAPATLDDIIEADLSVSKVLTLGLARNRAWGTIAAAVTVDSVAVDVCKATVRTRVSALVARHRPRLLVGRISTCRRTATAATRVRRDASLA
jgi:hypothetical protein